MDAVYVPLPVSEHTEWTVKALSVEFDGGAVGDLGCYCVSAIRLFAGEPKRVYADQVRDGHRRHLPVDPDGGLGLADPEVVAEAWRTWREEVAFAERFVDEAPDLDLAGKEGHVLREILVHMIEEYARHNGHADFLRERIDGRVGQ